MSALWMEDVSKEGTKFGQYEQGMTDKTERVLCVCRQFHSTLGYPVSVLP